MKKIYFITTQLIIAISCFAVQPEEIKELQQIFEKYNVNGSILIYNQKENVYLGYNLASCITQYQQIYFLYQLYHLRLPISEKAMQLTKQMMLQEESTTYKLSGKTGWAVRQKENITWFVGFVETKENVYFFATNVEANENTDLNTFSQIRINLTKEALRALGIINDDDVE